MNDAYDSELVHAIDQQLLAESEPFYEGSPERSSADSSSGQREHNGEFRVELPEERQISGVIVDEERLETVLDRYVDEIEAELQSVFGLTE
jgi:hypothetical protein